MPTSNEKIHWSSDFDGDGLVFQAEVVTYPTTPRVYVRLTLNSGTHVTMVELNADDRQMLRALLSDAEVFAKSAKPKVKKVKAK